MGETTFVTGGTGFLGRHLIPALCRAGHTVRVLTREPEAHTWLKRYSRIEIIRGDVTGPDSLVGAFDGCTYAVHAAGLFRFWGDWAYFEHTNVRGTQNVLRAAAGVPLKKFVHISTVALIGTPDPNRLVDETHPAQPADNYQKSKLMAENMARAACAEYGLPVVVLRPGAFYGPLGTYAFNRLFFRDPLRGIIMQVNQGRYITFPAYIADVANAILLAFTRGRAGEVYNICGDSLTHKEAFDIICAEGNIWYPRLTIPGWVGVTAARLLTAFSTVTRSEPFYPLTLRSYVYNYWRVSSDKAKRELGFAPLDFRDGARRTLAWYRAGQPEHIPEVDC